ncbi:MAG: thermonuclease family protein [Parvibaculaceae bacterium]|nr:thermonuclease family protein [Parvibaculaceae bacterium]
MLALALTIGGLISFHARAAVPDTAGTCRLQGEETARVANIVDGDTLVLNDGRQVRLAGTQAPKLPLGRRNFRTWPLADQSRAALEKLSLGKTVTLRYGGAEKDRYQRLLAHLFLPDGRWIQQAMIEQGLARVYSFPDNQSCVDALLASEQTARTARRGIWALTYYAIRDAADASRLRADEGTYQLVEGKAVSAALVRKTLYINFGSDWKTDFTVRISPGNLGNFSGEPWQSFIDDPRILAGARLRVRGWVGNWNGAEIAVTHPGQIELLDH